MQMLAVEHVLALQAERARINAIPFEDIQWTENGKPITLTPEQIKEWTYAGLSNTSWPECRNENTVQPEAITQPARLVP